jgi:parvulin-like peptidyl-prolyl isomerase
MLKQLFPLVMITLFLSACSGTVTTLPVELPSATPLTPEATLTPLPPTETPIPPAVTVNTDQISLDEYNAEMERYQAALTTAGKTATEEEARQAVSTELISQILLAQGALEAGYSLDAGALQQKLDDLAAKLGGADKLQAWQQDHHYSEASFAEALKRGAASAWMRDKIMSTVSSTSEQVHIREILLYNEDAANNIYDRIQNGASFEEIATQIDPDARGDIGWFPRGFLPEKSVEDAAFALETGAYSQVVPGEAGFHIVKLIERQSDRLLDQNALIVLQNRALNEWLADRRQKSKISGSLAPVAP